MIMTILLVMTPSYHSTYSESSKFKIEYWYKEYDKQMIVSFFAILLLFNVHCNIMDIRKELFHPTLRRTKKVLNYSLFYIVGLAMSIGAAGYYALGETFVPVFIFLRQPLNKRSVEDIV